MRRISGLTDEQILAYEARIEAATRVGMRAVMDAVADRIAAIQTASVLVAADGTEPVSGQEPDVPLEDGLPPGQPYVSPDDLSTIPPAWSSIVAENLLPIAAEIWLESSGLIHAGMVDAVGAPLPSVGSLAAEQYLAQARNTFEEIGDHLWATARSELLDGFEAGESIPQLAQRLRESSGIAARTGTLVARTQVIEASNYGSIAMARASGLAMQKEWIATPDPRTRPTHIAADGQRVGLADPFMVGGYSADFPADPSLPPSERYNCRCTLGYLIPEREARQVSREVPDPPLPG
ncbi:MAG TPA: phage minor head protein, partial [Actinoplanes sp.]|nr:phage minor head protein [Actinoplanes sp.]